MPPHNRFQYTSRSLDADIHTVVVPQGGTATLDSSADAGSSNLALPLVIPIVIGVVLIVAILLMPKGFFQNLANNVSIKSNKREGNARPWFRRRSPDEESSQTEKLQPTFAERHLETLRAWQKPTKLAQPPLSLYLAKADAAHQPRRPTGMNFHEWQERQRNTTVRSNPMHEFKLTRVGVKDSAYWKKITEEMAARKS